MFLFEHHCFRKKIEITSYPVLLHSMKALKPVKFITNCILQPYITGKCLTNKLIKECFSNHSIAIFHVLVEQSFNTVHIIYKKNATKILWQQFKNWFLDKQDENRGKIVMKSGKRSLFPPEKLVKCVKYNIRFIAYTYWIVAAFQKS